MVWDNEPFVPILLAAPCAAYFNDCTTPDDIGADIAFILQDTLPAQLQSIVKASRCPSGSLKSSSFFPSMLDKSLTENEFMNLCGDWIETETAIQLWSIFGKYELSLRHIRYTIILKQFGGAGIGGTLEKYGP